MINIYKASAGSGKTFTLAREYIKLILGHKDTDGRYVLNPPGTRTGHRSVLAMTFTNKATEEMKSRIIHELAVLAGRERGWTDASPYEKDLCDIFGCDPVRLANAASEALSGLLFDFNRFSISTIDSFFQSVLRSFAHEADVSSNYALELDDEEVITMSVDKLLQSLNQKGGGKESHRLEAWITRYMKSLIEKGNQFTLFNRGGNVQSDLIYFIAKINNDTFKDNEERIMSYLSDEDKFPHFCKIVVERISDFRKSVMQRCESAMAALDAMGEPKTLINNNIYNNLHEWRKYGWKKYPDNTLPKTVLKVIGEPSQMWKADVRKKSMADGAVEAEVLEALEAIESTYNEVTLLNIIRDNLYQLGLMKSVMAIVDEYRRENSTLLLSDTNSLLSKIIGDDDSPFLYEKLGMRFQHYLIDEFQDTSLSQWNNMMPLLKESLSYDHDNLVIGDEKQCIYRFRNSDPSLLHNLHTQSWTQGRTEVRGDAMDENTNWRSSADVVRFNNTLFTSIARQYGFADVYSNVAQQVSGKHLGHRGYVLLSCFDRDSDKEEEALAQMSREIRRELESGYKPGDIAILLRQVKEGEKVIRYLEDLRRSDPTFPKFDIISDKSLLLSHSDAVSNVISRLRMLTSKDVTVDSRRKSAREVAKIINDYESAHTSGMDPDDALKKAIAAISTEGCENGCDDARQESVSIHGIDLMSLVESIITTHVDRKLKESDSVYIVAFLDAVSKFMSQGRADMRSFLEWWDETGSKLSVAGSTDDKAINILTVHKSKGLEFSCVHIPFAEFSTSLKGDTAWFELPHLDGIPQDLIPPMMPLTVSKAMSNTPLADKYAEIRRENQLDQTNLLYVAFTRAVDELIVGVEVKKSIIEGKYSEGSVPDVARTIFDGINNSIESDGIHLAFDENMRLVIGEPTHKLPEKIDRGTAMRPTASVRISGYDSTSADSVWSNTNVDNQRLNHIKVARERGLILHELMSRIRYSEDIDRAFTLLKSTPDSKLLSEEDINGLREIVEARVYDESARQWFSGYKKLLVEREIVTEAGDVLRVDRVVWTASGELHVIDFKSGSQDPRRYVGQVKKYMSFFSSLGYSHVRGFLYYLDSGRIVEIR